LLYETPLASASFRPIQPAARVSVASPHRRAEADIRRERTAWCQQPFEQRDGELASGQLPLGHRSTTKPSSRVTAPPGPGSDIPATRRSTHERIPGGKLSRRHRRRARRRCGRCGAPPHSHPSIAPRQHDSPAGDRRGLGRSKSRVRGSSVRRSRARTTQPSPDGGVCSSLPPMPSVTIPVLRSRRSNRDGFGPGRTSWGAVMPWVVAPMQLASRNVVSTNAAATRCGKLWSERKQLAGSDCWTGITGPAAYESPSDT
jgi:hypothetical protein